MHSTPTHSHPCPCGPTWACVQVPTGDLVIQPNTVVRLPGQGMPISKQATAGGKGDLVVHFDVQFPARLSHQQKQAVKQALPAA